MKDNTKIYAVFRLSALGDILLTTGVLDYWHRTHGFNFIFITRKGITPALENHPAITRIIGLDEEDLHGFSWFRKAGQLAKELAEIPLLDLHGTLRSRVLGFRWKGEVIRYPKFGVERRLYRKRPTPELREKLESTSVTQRYAMALDGTPPPASELTPVMHLTEIEDMEGPLNAGTATSGQWPIVALHPYATHPAKEWPRDNWIELIKALDRDNIHWIIIGRDNDPLMPGNKRDMTNTTSLRETAAMLKHCNVLVTNDSGPMHIASAVDTPVVAFFGPTAKVWGFYPAGPQNKVLEKEMACRPCSLHGGLECSEGFECLRGITVNDALAAIKISLED